MEIAFILLAVVILGSVLLYFGSLWRIKRIGETEKYGEIYHYIVYSRYFGISKKYILFSEKDSFESHKDDKELLDRILNSDSYIFTETTDGGDYLVYAGTVENL